MSLQAKKEGSFSILYLLILIAGMSFSVTGAIIPEISATFLLSRTAVASLPQAQFFGGFFGLIVLGALISRVQPRLLLAGAILKMAAVALLIGLTRTYTELTVFLFFCVGTSMSIIFGLTGVIVSRASGAQAARNLNIHYSFMSAGVVLSPLVYAALSSAGQSYRAIFLVIAALGFSAGFAVSIVSLPHASLGSGYSRAVGLSLFRDHRRFLALILLMSFCYMGSESIPNNWIPKYLDDTFAGFSEFRSRLVLSLFWTAVTVGRYICAGVLSAWRKPRRLLALLCLLAGGCLLAAPNMGTRIFSETVLVVSGLFLSGIIPIIFSFSEQLPSSLSSIVFILILTVGMLGASLTSRAVGFLTDRAGFRLSIMAGALPLFVVIALVPYLTERRNGEEIP
jgi:FHS family L-fucose permease-like MFS transporter